ncbi:GTP cyclohydrolase I [Herbiconiux sp. CPCC 203407]|uniref:GTP cyclohydrolase 1 n=1 Tax=Herbiconiux oxytropis TaxID=2970915 RepID=A0AA41XIR3_9MICO|nr:GTP cyclohydrolase I [Herbiconiux oxytropis]MCS5722329.1 GTP cyclohydrolase I [Herbiconiux oxytropis]MCS5727274.1 GTP cyclohydrolase I [Herbiconiux oxytropis]
MSSVDRARIEAAVGEILAAIGEDPEREGLAETPRRVAEAYAELFGSVGTDPAEALGATFAPPAGATTDDTQDEPAQPVLLRDITFRSICEHHLLPFEGVVHAAYLPGAALAGLGGVVAVIESASSRPQLQERLTDDIAEALERGLDARGVLVVVEAKHGCVSARGRRQALSTTVTLSARGALAEPAARAELMTLIGDRAPDAGGSAR